MIQTDNKTNRCRITGKYDDITSEAIVILATICHDIIEPIGENPAEYLARVCVQVLNVLNQENLFVGKTVMMALPIKEKDNE